jgi:hypothetical protein
MEEVEALLNEAAAARNPAVAASSAASSTTTVTDAERFRIEKRCIRYALLYQHAVRLGIEGATPERLRAMKETLLPLKRYHRCFSQDCKWENWPARDRPWIRDPFVVVEQDSAAAAAAVQASGMVYVCALSHKAHICGDGHCRLGTQTAEHDITCTVSGQVIGTARIDNSFTGNQKRRFQDDPGSDGGGSSTTYHHRSYKIRRPTLPSPSPSPAAAAVPAPPPPTALELLELQPKKRSRRKRTRTVPCKLPASALADSSVYGTKAIMRVAEEIGNSIMPESDRLLVSMIFSEEAQRRTDARALEVENKADKQAKEYVRICREHDRMPDPTIFRCIYWRNEMEVVDRAFAQAFLIHCNRHGSGRICQEYFREALTRAFAMLQCTPQAVAEKHQVPFRKVALGLLTYLHEGLTREVWFHRESLRAIDHSELISLTNEQQEDYESITVRHIPAHHGLRALPSDVDMRAVAGDRYSSTMVSLRKVLEYFDSLVSYSLQIDQISAYCLEKYMTIRNPGSNLRAY